MTIQAAALAALKDELGKVHGDYKEVTETQAALLNAQAENKENHKKLTAQFRDLQQYVDRPRGEGGPDTVSAAAELTEGLNKDAAFRQLAASGKGSAAFQITAPLAAIIGTDGNVGSGMTTVPSNPERTGYVTSPVPALSLLDVLPSRSTDRDAVEHVRFDIVEGEAATQVNQGDEKSELSMAGKLVSAAIETIAATQPASRQVLDDNAGLQSLIESIMMKEVRRKLEQRILYGDGSPGMMLGLSAVGTAYAPTATNTVDKIGECVTAMQDEGFNPSIIAIRATQWFKDVATMKDSNGQYLIGNPAQPAAPTLWNGNVVKPASLQANTVMVIDPAYVTVLDRQAVQVLISDSHKDFFTRNLVMILCELRAGLEVTNAKAVRIITL